MAKSQSATTAGLYVLSNVVERSRRRLFQLLAVLLVLGPCIPAFAQAPPVGTSEAVLYEAAKKEGTVVWYTSSPLEPMIAIGQAFEKRYPGIKVEVARNAGVQQYQRFMQEVEAKRFIADVLSNSDQPSMKSLIDDGHISAWRIPTFDRFAEQYRIGEFAYSNALTDLVIVYNINKVSPEEVKLLASDWAAVLDPRFKGRFAATNMLCGTCYAGIQLFLDPKYKDRFGEAFLRKVAAQKPAVYADIVVALDRVVAGEKDFTFWTWEAVATTKWQQGAPIRWVHPNPTPTFGLSFQGVSKYAPHPNAARLFQNWTMSEEGATALQTIYGTPTTMSGVTDARPVTKESWWTPVDEVYPIDFDRWNRDFTKDMALWVRILRDSR